MGKVPKTEAKISFLSKESSKHNSLITAITRTDKVPISAVPYIEKLFISSQTIKEAPIRAEIIPPVVKCNTLSIPILLIKLSNTFI